MLEKLPQAIGHALQGQRAGLDKILFNRIDLRNGTAQLEISSLAFADHAPIPALYTADGDGASPPLAWRGVPETATTLALIVEDADSPTPEPLVHAIAVEIDARSDGLSEGGLSGGELSPSALSHPAPSRPAIEGSAPSREHQPTAPLNLGRNSYLRQSWLPPDPPPGHGPHRYAFQLFALRAGDPFSAAPGRDELAKAVLERAIASGCLIGTYERDPAVKLPKAEISAEPAPLGAATLEPAM